MTVFDTAIDLLFGDINLALDGTYTPDGGSAASVRVILSIEDDPTDVFNARKVVRKISADIRTSQLAASAAGDVLVIGSDTYTVANPQKNDADQLVWTMDLIE